MTTPMPELAPMPCPWGHCLARHTPIVHRTDPSDPTQIAIVYPMHDVAGINSWFGRCPASQLIVAPRLTAAGRQVLADADDAFVSMFADRINKVHGEAVEQLGPGATDEQLRDLMRELMRRRPPVPSRDDYFPGRPADAPEPGVGEQAATKLPLDQPGYPLGKAGEMSTQETHVAMVLAARTAIGDAQEKLAVAILALEDVEKAVAVLPPAITAAHGLVHAAVGGATNLPEVAVNMRSAITAALDTVTGESNVAQVVLLLRARVIAVAAQLEAASRDATIYAAMPK